MLLTTFALVVLLAPQDPPPRIEWQRSLADALAVQQRTKLPLLLCVNQDGEPFCERFANETYLDPAFVERTRGWVCIVASPDRHTERDYDGQGRRVECPRFPGVTCSEHMNVEPELYARWFKGQRTAPRHIGVAPDGTVLFDRFLDQSMQAAIDAVTAHRGEPGPQAVPPTVEGLFARHDARSREALEARYRRADRLGRLQLLGMAGGASNRPFDLVRMGLRDDDDGVFAAAAEALAKIADKDALIDVEDALARCDDAALAQRLLAAAGRVAADFAPARQFVQHRNAALAAVARADAEPFATVLRAAPAPLPPAPDRVALDQALDAAERAAKDAPTAAALLALAEANLALADFLLPEGGTMLPLFFEDARRAAARAAEAQPSDAQRLEAEAIQTIVRWQQGDGSRAREHGANALALAQQLGAGCDASPRWFAGCCGALARAASLELYGAVQRDAEATAPDTVAAAALPFVVLAGHPWGTEADVQQAAQLFAFAGARQVAQQVLRRGIEKFPWSRELHEAYRLRVLADRGAQALRARYATFVEHAADEATAQWFAGYAAIVAAEANVRDKRPAAAQEAYSECIERFRRSAAQNEGYADSANHFAVLALAARALLKHQAGDAEGAVQDLLAARALRPASLTEQDGLGRRPDAILRRVERELREGGKAELADKLAN